VLKCDISEVEVSESNIQQEIIRLELAEKQCVSKVERTVKELLKIADDLKRRVDETVNQLMQRLSEVKRTASEVTSEIKVQLDMVLAEMQSFIAYSTGLVDKGRPSDATQAYKDLHSRAETLLKYDEKTASSNLPEIDVSASEILDKLSMDIIPLGKL
jgi:hypothetical protein